MSFSIGCYENERIKTHSGRTEHGARNNDRLSAKRLTSFLRLNLIGLSFILLFVAGFIGYSRLLQPITAKAAAGATPYTESWNAGAIVTSTQKTSNVYGCPDGSLLSTNAFPRVCTFGFSDAVSQSLLSGETFTVQTWNVSGSVGGSSYTETWTGTNGIYSWSFNGSRFVSNGIPVDNTSTGFAVTAWQVKGQINP